jgi:two-component system, chemotaxis family, sensor kinase CheA
LAEGDKARGEFLSESQELIENLSRNLLALEESRSKGGGIDAEHLNEAFRSVHTLKSLAGLFGDRQMNQLSHRLEDLLDDLRLGRHELTDDTLDLLFTAVDVYWQLLGAQEGTSNSAVGQVLAKLEAMGPAAPTPTGELDHFAIDPGLLAVLTEYEEHRLVVSIRQGLGLYLVRIQFELATLDKALTDIKERAKPLGEVITYLPAGDADSPEFIRLDLLLATGAEEQALIDTLGGPQVDIRAIPRRTVAPVIKATESPQQHTTAMPVVGTNTDVIQGRPAHQRSLSYAGAQLRSISQTVRVDIRKLDELMNVVGNLALLRSALVNLTDQARADGQRQLSSELHRLNHSFERRLRELQSRILEVRMVPLSQVFERLTRVVRQTSRDLNKEVRLVVTGAETEIDKLIVEELSDPLMHIIRNAIDHGIEDADERVRLGKPRSGTIALNAFQKGNHVVIEADDDGRGLNSDALIDRAVKMGAIVESEARELSRNEALNLIFLPGLSTRDTASTVSGRGVGMDVVKTNIAKLGGAIELGSEALIGTKITITLPITLAIVAALLVQVAGRVFAVPLTSVSEAITLNEADIRFVDNKEILSLRGVSLQLCRLGDLFSLSRTEAPARQFVVVVVAGAKKLGLVVDTLRGQQDIVIKALGNSLGNVRGFAGASELGDHRIALVLDPGALIEETSVSSDTPRVERLRSLG